MIGDFSHQIKLSKDKLRKKSKNYKKNFYKIKTFIEHEIKEIELLKKKSKKIIPEINYKNLSHSKDKIYKSIYKRGCVIIRDVFEDTKIDKLK